MHLLRYRLELFQSTGATTFAQYLLGTRSIATSDPANMEAILSTSFDDYGLGLRSPAFHPLLGSHGIFTQDGQAWKASRKTLRPVFSTTSSEEDGNFMAVKRCVEELAASIRQSGSDSRQRGKWTVDLQPLFFKLTFDTTLFLLFGEKVGSAADWRGVKDQESAFSRAFKTAQDYLAHRGRLGSYYWLLNDKAFREACRTCHQFVDEAVDKALRSIEDEKRDSSSYVLIDALAQKTQDRNVLRDQTLNVLLAGRDTTGCCLAWTFRLLARHRDTFNRLRNEVESVCALGVEATPLTRAQLLRDMPYLKMVIKEVLRLYPSVPANTRDAVRDTVLPTGGGPDGQQPVLVHAGERVGYSVYAMHRRKDIYGEDADLFRPERWSEQHLQSVGWAYLPFNGGPRICLGQEFALLEVYYTVARLIQLFPDMETPLGDAYMPEGEERQALTLVVSPADGCRVTMRERSAVVTR
ncbi:hypothetical protein Sste5346_004704 [Sporothrix stenoceras]|uniref:Cytochrome P450 alkane hydroxylase n=1 Tax=Sporothrix stenoceras TaxID=5173 RepID=A0ABR3Z6Q9_9PEZI